MIEYEMNNLKIEPQDPPDIESEINKEHMRLVERNE